MHPRFTLIYRGSTRHKYPHRRESPVKTVGTAPENNIHGIFRLCKVYTAGGICGNCGDTRVQFRTPADRSTRVKDWWFKYVKLAAEQLQSSFLADESQLYPAIHGALDVASGCSRCRDTAKQALETFTPLLLERVQEIITKVRISEALIRPYIKFSSSQAESDLDLPF